MRHLRLRYLSVMGLAACTPKETPVADVTPPATASVAASATVTASATATASVAASATASASATITASATAAAPALDAGAFTARKGSWDIQFPNRGGALGSNNPKYCPNAPARCYLASDLGGGACPKTITVACGCHPGGACMNANAPCAAPENTTLDAQETKKKGAPACCYETPFYCVLPWEGRTYDALPAFDSASEWERMAAAEYASVASFARASLELLALGAPPDLVRDTHLAALDEIEHARFAYAMAGKNSPEPVPIAPLRNLSIEDFAVAVLVEACGPETSGAEAMERRGLQGIAEDERRHAELAWRTLAWAVRTSDAAREALLRAIPRVETTDAIVRDVVIPCAIELATESRSAHPATP